jgi:predicted metalloprotease with PDZ domain
LLQRNRWAAVATAGFLALLGGSACGRSARVACSIAPVPDHPDRLEVTLELSGLPRDGVTLKGFATKSVLRLSDIRAQDAAGKPLRAEEGIESVTVNNRTLDIPRIAIAGPIEGPITVRYVASPGAREGDSHMGFTGRCEGYLGKEFGFATGRELFLLPTPPESIRRIEVAFSLPPSWSAIAPWRRDGDRLTPGVDGDYAAEHLISAAIGLGKFRERSFRIDGTTYRLAFEAGIPPGTEEQVAGRLEVAARYIHGLFGKDLGPEYLTVVLPRAPTGDDISGEGWATGQGETLAPLTGNRLHQFSLQLVDAYLRHAPYRSEIGAPEEFWLVDGISNLYAWKAVAAAGLITEDEVTQEMAVGYLTSIGVQGIERNLEKLYSTTASVKIPREVMAPMVLASIDHELRASSGGATSLDTVIGRTYRGRRAASFWKELARLQKGPWEDYRARYAQGKAALPVELFYNLTPATEKPVPPAGPVVRSLTVAFTGKAHGYLENCGCKVNQSGGVARRSTVLRALRKTDPNLLLIDAGDAFLMPEKQSELDFLSRGEQDLYLRTMDFMRYQAAAIGTAELAFGTDDFRKAIRGKATPFLAANIHEDGKPIAPGSILLHAGSLRVAVIGIFESPRARAANAIYEDHTAALTFDDPVETLKREVPRLKQGADLVFAAGRLTPPTIRRVAAACPDLDVIFSTDYDAAIRLKEHADEIHQEDHGGFVGRTFVAYSNLTNYGFYSIRLGLDRSGRVASGQFTEHWLRENVPDDPPVREMLNRFYDRIGKEAAAQESVPPLFADDPVRLTGHYVGADRCTSCHPQEFAQWRRTKHGTAYKTLLDRHRHFQPKCVSCHVVGFGTPTGYHLGTPGEKLANVQCEVCHGPGAAHAESPSAANIRRQVPAKVCLECHTPDHSDHFVYEERLPKIKHDYYD